VTQTSSLFCRMPHGKKPVIALYSGCALLAFGCTSNRPAAKAPPVASVALNCAGHFSGPGARPVSTTTVANWYIEDGRLVYAVFLRGASGWYNKRTEWRMQNDSAGRYVQNFDVGGFHYSLSLDKSAGTLSVLGTSTNMRDANIILLDRLADGAVIRHAELQEFCWHSAPDVVAEVLARSKEIQRFIATGITDVPGPSTTSK
jgi:hypothetical protein